MWPAAFSERQNTRSCDEHGEDCERGLGGNMTMIKWLAPQIAIQFYLSVCLILLFWGPWDWQIQKPEAITSYLLISQLAILAGYLCSFTALSKDQSRRPVYQLGPKLTGIAIFVSAVMAMPTSLARLGTLVTDIVSGISAPGKVYTLHLDELSKGNGYVAIEYVRMLLAPLLFGA